jgi:Ca-activated chloride channel family protein
LAESKAPPPSKPIAATPPSAPVPTPRAPAPEETAIDPNGRFATTYRPGGGHLSAFESAVTAGLIPASETELVSDVGSRYLPEIAPPESGALAFQADFEREKLAPTGGPVHLRFSLRSTEQAAKDRPPLSVVVVLDVSGSMRGQLISSARAAATELVGKLADTDEFGLVTFSSEASLLIPIGRIGSNRQAILEKIGAIKEGGGTNISGGLQGGYGELAKSKNKDAVRVAMLLSDGRANAGITARAKLSQLALNAFQDGIQTSAFGLGTDYDGPLMSQIAGDGAGGYYFLKDPGQIAGALTTELGKRLDPVATALEIRVRLKPGVEALKVYGSRRLSKEEADRVRATEVAQDLQTEKRDKIKANRQEDAEGGMRFFIPAFARADAHSLLFKLRLPEGVGEKDVAIVEVKYKDRLTKKNVLEEIPLKIAYADSDLASAKSTNPAVQRTVQGFLAGESLMQASALMAERRTQEAIDLLGQREGLLQHAAAVLGEPLFVQDSRRLARLREHAGAKTAMSDPLVLAMLMETAGSVHLH